MSKTTDSWRMPGNSSGIRLLFVHAPYLIACELLAVLAVLWLLPERSVASSIFLWLSAWGVSVLVRVWPIVDQGDDQDDLHSAGARARDGRLYDEKLHRSARIYVAGCLLAGVVWGVLSWLVLQPSQPFNTAFVLLLSMGVAALAVAAQLAWPPAWLAYVIPIVVIVGDRLLAASDGFAMLALLLAVLLLICIVFLLRHQHLSAVASDGAANGRILHDMQKKQIKAEDASREKSRFLAAASHDLRQPVHTLNLLVGSLEARSHDAQTREIVDKMREVLGGLDSLFGSLLDLSKLDAAVVKPEMRVLSLATLFDGLNNEFAGAAKKAGLKLSFDAQGLFVQSDSVNLWRVLSNLISNAIRYTPSGAVRIRCYPDKTHVRIAVQDTGIGISEAELPHVFDEFHQIGNEERDRSKGLGLGLAIVRKTCDMLGCAVSVSSTPGKGSVFTVEVPRVESLEVESAAMEQQTLAKEVSEQSVSTPVATPLAGLQVLIIDDEPDVRDGMRILFAQWGCAAMLAESGADALAQVATSGKTPDLLIVDYRLRERETGADAIAAVRRQCGILIPAMILTGDTAPERIREAKEAGCPLLHKPVQPGK
ncbi:MAG: hybrid sensor histidine kinase/response regulator, partial [Mariprofundaceae bacterium]|nr:hybrid sensor histidine kinase/response regulator [Mariprofundaceae bacterium]